MNSVVFSTGSESYQVSHIVYAGHVSEIPEDRRKNGSTHSFKIVTTAGADYCYYKSQELAQNARDALAAMLRTYKPSAFANGKEMIDPQSVVSYSSVVTLKNPTDGLTHAVVVTLDTTDEKSRKAWLKYHSEESARKARNALFAKIHAARGVAYSAAATGKPVEAEVEL